MRLQISTIGWSILQYFGEIARAIRSVLADVLWPDDRARQALFCRLNLEPLGERVLPAAFYWNPDPNVGNRLASEKANWTDNTGNSRGTSVPGINDTVVFGKLAMNRNCTWDIGTAVADVRVKSDYSGAISLVSDLKATQAFDYRPSGGGIEQFAALVTRRVVLDVGAGGGVTEPVLWGGSGNVSVPVVFGNGIVAELTGTTTKTFTSVQVSGSVSLQSGDIQLNQLTVNAGGSFSVLAGNNIIASGQNPSLTNNGTFWAQGNGIVNIGLPVTTAGTFGIDKATTVRTRDDVVQSGANAVTNFLGTIMLGIGVQGKTFKVSGGSFLAGNSLLVGTLQMDAGALGLRETDGSPSHFSIDGALNLTASTAVDVALMGNQFSTITIDKDARSNTGGSVTLGDGQNKPLVRFIINATNRPTAGAKSFLQYKSRTGEFRWDPSGASWNDPGSKGKVSKIATPQGKWDYEAIVERTDIEQSQFIPAGQGASLGGKVWQDSVVVNGMWDPGEGGAAGVTVYIADSTGSVVANTTSAVDGSFLFTGLASGTYTLSAQLPQDAVFTDYHVGSDPNLDSDIDPATGTSAPLNLAPDQTLTANIGLLTVTLGEVSSGSGISPTALPTDAPQIPPLPPFPYVPDELNPTSTSLCESLSTSSPGQAVIFTAAVSSLMGFTPTGLVDFMDNGTTLLGNATLSQGPMGAQATFTDAALALGGHSITAVFQGDAADAGSTSSAVSETVQQLMPFVSLSASTQSAAPGQAVTFTANVNSMSGGTPTGTINLMDGTTQVGIGTLVPGSMGSQATVTTSTLPVGPHTITAVYSGDAAFVSATSPVVTETITQPMAFIGLSASTLTSTAGQAVTFTVTVSPPPSGTIPTGSVIFRDGMTTLGTVNLSTYMGSAQAVLTISTFGVGSHNITAVYSGDATYPTVTSSVVTETVQQGNTATTSTYLSTSTPNAFAGQAVTLTAIVTRSGMGAMPTGSVVFSDGTVTLATVALSSYMGMGSQAAVTISTLSVGNHTITAVYSGDGTYPGSTSNTIVETVQRASAMEMESTSNSYALFGQAVTFTATIYSMGGVAPTGTVAFWDGSTLLGTINLSQVGTNYQAAFTISTLSRGSHTIVAVYSGDQDFNSATASVGETIS